MTGCQKVKEPVMRLCRFDNGKYGVVREDTIYDVTAIVERIMRRVPEGRGDPVIAHLDDIRASITEPETYQPYPVSAVKLLSPVASPSKLVAAPTNYRAHVAEMAADRAVSNPHLPQEIGKAGLFLKASSALVGPSEGVALRFPERRNDHEVELVMVIGREGSDIAEERALDYVAAYTLGLDMTLRGPEDRSFRKSIDTYAVLGPWLVTADEIADPDNVEISLAVNGESRQRARTSDLIYGTARLIALASSFYTLLPGDVIYTGTPEGVGPVKPGDVMVAESPAIGRMQVAVRLHRT
jgi:2-keto-4-pentenoate hydratase/2-oxohepta-3-ene-1,7-dioic acid hydratase in catechol pathway